MTTPMMLDISLLRNAWPHEGDFKERLLEVMRLARQRACWATQDDQQFQVALGVALLNTPDGPDREWLDAQVTGLKGLSALISGVPVDTEAWAAQMSAAEKRDYTLVELWHQSKGARA